MMLLQSMVNILDGNSENIVHAYRKIGLFGENNTIFDCFRSYQITEIAPYVRTFF